MSLTNFPDLFDSTVDTALEWLADNGQWFFDAANDVLQGIYEGLFWLLKFPPPFVISFLIAVLGWRLAGPRFAIGSFGAMMFCAFIGLWPETMSTLALVVSATLLALVFAVPLGVIAGLLPAFDRFVEPVLDLIQTMPPYIYLLPAIALLGYGSGTALVATFIVAFPPAFRLTSLGIRQTPVAFTELGEASGLTGWQMFTKIRLPFAMPSIMAGVNQSLMMAFGMVVIAGIVGSGGLGQAIYSAIRVLDITTSVNAAIAIVILTMVLDGLAQNATPAPRKEQQS